MFSEKIPNNAKRSIEKKKNGEDDFDFFGQVTEPGTEKNPEAKKEEQGGDCNAKYFIEFAHSVL
jgi:hypothetical protein